MSCSNFYYYLHLRPSPLVLRFFFFSIVIPLTSLLICSVSAFFPLYLSQFISVVIVLLSCLVHTKVTSFLCLVSIPFWGMETRLSVLSVLPPCFVFGSCFLICTSLSLGIYLVKFVDVTCNSPHARRWFYDKLQQSLRVI
jgi:hypothetical protein